MTAATIPLRARRPSRLLGAPPCELTISVLTGEHRGRQISIRAAKCTIGSAKGCTLRLEAAGVHSLHCWILRGSGGTIIRRRHPHTRLNGRPFTDAALMPGDRLQVGSVELEIQRCPLVPPDWTRDAGDLPEIADSSETDRQAWEQASRESAESIERLREERRGLERRAAQQLSDLNDLVTRVSAERDTLQQRLRTIEFEAASERDTLSLARQQLELALAASNQQLTELRGHVSSRESETQSLLQTESRRLADMQSRLDQVLAERSALENQLRQQVETHRLQSESRQAECDRLQGECQRLDGQLAQLRELVGYTAADRDRLTLELDGEGRRLIDQNQQIAEEKSDLQRRHEAALAQLAEAERRLAVLQVEGDNHLHTEMEQASQLKQRLEQIQREKSDLEERLAVQTATWHDERESLRQQTVRVSDHSKQLDGQLVHVRELVESLASERDSLCQQLEATEMRLTAEQEQFQQELNAAKQQVQEQQALAEQWRSRAEEGQQQLTSAGEQLTQATERFASLRGESESRLHDESGRAAQLAEEAHTMRERLLAVESQLADTAARFAALQAESEQRLQSEQRRTAASQQRAVELEQQLAASDGRLVDAEHRLSAFKAEGDSRLQASSAKEAELQQQLAERESRLATIQVESESRLREQSERLSTIEARLAEQEARTEARCQQEQQRAADAETRSGQLQQSLSDMERQHHELLDSVRFERDTWNHDRERLHQECRMLGHRLIEKQKELDEVQERARAVPEEAPHGSMTVVLDSSQQQPAEDSWNEHQRAAHEAERQRLAQRVAELEQQLSESQQFTQGMTLGGEAIAQLREEAGAPSSASEVAELTSQLAAVRLELAEAQNWRGRCDEIQAQLAEQQVETARRGEQIEQLQNQLADLAQQPPTTETQVAADDGSQLAALQAHEDQQQELDHERRALAEDRASFDQSREQLQHERDEFAQTQAEFESRWRQWEETLRSKEQLLNRQAEELSERLERAATQLQEAESQKALLADQQATLERQAELLLARHKELAPVESKPVEAQSVEAQSAESPPAESPPAESPPVESDVYSSANQRSLEVPEHCAAQFAPSSDEDNPEPKPVWTPPSAPTPPADDDSIEAYMFRLLKRVRGDGPSPAPAFAPPPPPTPVPRTNPKVEQDADVPVTMTIAASIEPVKPEEFLPRNKAPELNLAAMREVANSAARNAIVKHQRKSGGRKAMSQSVGAAMTLLCAGAAAYFAWKTHSLPATIGAGIGVLAAAYWGSKAAGHGLSALFLRVPTTQPRPSALLAAEKPEQVPADAPAQPAAGLEAGDEAVAEGQSQTGAPDAEAP